MKIIYVNFNWRNEYGSNPWSYEHYLRSGENKGPLAHSVENCIGITEVMGSNPVWTWIFFRPYLHYFLSSVHNHEDCFYIWSKYILVDLKDIEQTYRGIHIWKKEGSKVLKLNTNWRINVEIPTQFIIII